jgi:protein phosphatase PTC7
MRPHPAKAHRGGEDAYSLADGMVAVSDGVGGWASSGINPAFFSRSLVS